MRCDELAKRWMLASVMRSAMCDVTCQRRPSFNLIMRDDSFHSDCAVAAESTAASWRLDRYSVSVTVSIAVTESATDDSGPDSATVMSRIVLPQ
jgi:hypothetical protein